MISDFFGGIWAKLVAVAAIVGGVILLFLKVFQLGKTAERAKNMEAVIKHQTKTSEQVSKSDEALADPKSTRADRVRKRFSRD